LLELGFLGLGFLGLGFLGLGVLGFSWECGSVVIFGCWGVLELLELLGVLGEKKNTNQTNVQTDPTSNPSFQSLIGSCDSHLPAPSPS
jgi:hypothetical protein